MDFPGWMGGEFTDNGWNSLSALRTTAFTLLDPATAMLVLGLATQSSVML
jgi:hypothetical protein